MISFRKKILHINFYPPYLGAGISVKNINETFTKIEVQLKMRWYNKNLVGTHFGGSMYSMCDPFYMFILMKKLGKDYIVWDKAASIQFLKPGSGTLTADFEILENEILRIKTEVDTAGKGNFIFKTIIRNEKEETIATVEKTVYVRNKQFQLLKRKI